MAGGVSLSLEPEFEWRGGLVLATDVAFLASSRAFFSVSALIDVEEEVEDDSGEGDRDGIIFPMNVHLLLV